MPPPSSPPRASSWKSRGSVSKEACPRSDTGLTGRYDFPSRGNSFFTAQNTGARVCDVSRSRQSPRSRRGWPRPWHGSPLRLSLRETKRLRVLACSVLTLSSRFYQSFLLLPPFLRPTLIHRLARERPRRFLDSHQKRKCLICLC